jgi:hypothetical protein
LELERQQAGAEPPSTEKERQQAAAVQRGRLSADPHLKPAPPGISVEQGLGFCWLTKLTPILTMNLRIRVGNSILLTNSDVRRALPESAKFGWRPDSARRAIFIGWASRLAAVLLRRGSI